MLYLQTKKFLPMYRKSLYRFLWLVFLVAACTSGNNQPPSSPREDALAKKMPQGIWLDSEDEEPSFRFSGDSIFFPDTTSQPATFKVIGDTLCIEGSLSAKYPIVLHTEHNFQFKNQSDDVVKLVKSDNPDDVQYFEQRPAVAINQRQTIKRDTVIFSANERYHCYVQVNPTRQKVVKPAINDDGVEVENVYYDNSIRFSLFHGKARLYQHDFHREDFKKLVPEEFLRQSVLSDLVFLRSDNAVIVYDAILAVPDSYSSYEVEVSITYDGKMSMRIADKES